jgi:hypothetical protein
MFNVKLGLISGGTAFALAFLASLLLGHVGLAIALLRALIFAALFFGLGTGAWALINSFIPELLSPDAQNNIVENVFSVGPEAGSQVNITVDDQIPANAALPQDSGSDMLDNDEVGDFADLASGTVKKAVKPKKDIDQSFENSYTDDAERFTPGLLDNKGGGLGEFSLDFGAFVSDGDGTEGPDSFMDSFSPFSSDSEHEDTEEIPMPERTVSKNKPEKLEGDFNPKEIAAGLRTVLEKDKKG